VMSAQIGCDAVATALVDAGPESTGFAEPCEGPCFLALCQRAVESLWSRVDDASAAEPITVRVSAVGTASVDDYARPQQFEGSWLGTLDVGDGAELRGEAVGQAPPPIE